MNMNSNDLNFFVFHYQMLHIFNMQFCNHGHLICQVPLCLTTN